MQINECYSLNVCVSPPKKKSYVEIPMPNVMILEGVFGRCLGHEGCTLMNGITAPMKETPQSFLAPSTT